MFFHSCHNFLHRVLVEVCTYIECLLYLCTYTVFVEFVYMTKCVLNLCTYAECVFILCTYAVFVEFVYVHGVFVEFCVRTLHVCWICVHAQTVCCKCVRTNCLLNLCTYTVFVDFVYVHSVCWICVRTQNVCWICLGTRSFCWFWVYDKVLNVFFVRTQECLSLFLCINRVIVDFFLYKSRYMNSKIASKWRFVCFSLAMSCTN